MKRVVSLFALCVMLFAMGSCTSDSAENDALYDNIQSPDYGNWDPPSGEDEEED